MSNWSASKKIIISLNNPPNIPSVPTGLDSGYVNISYSFSTVTVDPDGDSVAYQFNWGNNDTTTWSNFITSGESITMSKSWSGTGVYNIKARAKDNKGAISDWSNTHLIIISQVPVGTLKWRYQIGSNIPHSPAIANDGTIFIDASNSKFYAINPNGTLKWVYTATNTGSFISPAIASDTTIYCSFQASSSNDKLYAFNPNGTLKWTYSFPQGSIGTITLSEDGVIYVATGGFNGFYAINPNGTLKWNYRPGYEIGGNAAPAIASDGTAYCGTWWGNCIDALYTNGTLKWSFYVNGGVESGPSIGNDGTIYVGTVYNRISSSQPSYLYAINPNGTQKWSYLASGHIRITPAIASDGTIYFGTQDGILYALNPNGTMKWSNNIGAMFWSSCPVIDANGTVYIGSNNGNFYAIDQNGTLKWTYNTGGMVRYPAIGSDGTLYFGSADGYLYAIWGDGGYQNSSWLMYQHDCKHTGRIDGP